MFSEVKQQLVELKEEIKQMKGKQTGTPCIKGLLQTCALQSGSLGFQYYQSVMTEYISVMDTQIGFLDLYVILLPKKLPVAAKHYRSLQYIPESAARLVHKFIANMPLNLTENYYVEDTAAGRTLSSTSFSFVSLFVRETEL